MIGGGPAGIRAEHLPYTYKSRAVPLGHPVRWEWQCPVKFRRLKSSDAIIPEAVTETQAPCLCRGEDVAYCMDTINHVACEVSNGDV
jgi:hypothetical protein